MTPLFALLSAYLLCAAGTLATIRVCTWRGWVSRPRPDRWHRRPVALFGGVPMWAAFLVVAVVFVPWSNHELWWLIAVSSLLFLVGLYDDIYTLTAGRKLLLQCLAVSLVLAAGIVYPFRENMMINLLVSAFWLIGIVNAINLLDNMDGLSAGVAFIAVGYLAFIFWTKGTVDNVTLLSALGGVLLGFLLFNFHPAKIFMGDAGALFVGFLLASVTLLDVTHLSGISSLLFVPVLLLSIPILDTLFVSVTRRLRGQPISQGGTDHTSHRLVRAGLHERNAVTFLYVLSFVSGCVALWIHYLSPQQTLALASVWLLVLLLFGITLFRATPAKASEPKWKKHDFVNRALHPDSLSVLLDPLLLSLSYFGAFLLRFFGEIPPSDLSLFLYSWPIVLGVKFACLVGFGTYRCSWWRGSRKDVYRIAQAVLWGELLSVVLLLGVERFAGYSRMVFVFDAVLSGILFVAARQFSNLLQDVTESLARPADDMRRALVLGTDRGAHAALHLLGNVGMRCVGLIDLNHGRDVGRYVWGIPVVAGWMGLSDAARKTSATDIILAERDIPPSQFDQIVSHCRSLSLPLYELGLQSIVLPKIEETSRAAAESRRKLSKAATS